MMTTMTIEKCSLLARLSKGILYEFRKRLTFVFNIIICIQTVCDFKCMQFGNTQNEHVAQMTATTVTISWPTVCFHDQIIFKPNSEAALLLLHLPCPPKYPILFHSHSRTVLSSWATVFFFCPACTSHDQSHWATATNPSLTATTGTVTQSTKDGSQTGSVSQEKSGMRLVKRSKPANRQSVFNILFQTQQKF